MQALFMDNLLHQQCIRYVMCIFYMKSLFKLAMIFFLGKNPIVGLFKEVLYRPMEIDCVLYKCRSEVYFPSFTTRHLSYD